MAATAPTGILPQALAELYLQRRTGRLHLSHGEERVTAHWRDGRIVRVETRTRQRRHRPFPEPNDSAALRLNHVLEELGIDGSPSGGDGLAVDRRERLLRALSWPDPSCTFEEGGEPQAEDPSLTLSTEEVILEAVRRVEDPETVRAALGDMNQALCLPLELSGPDEGTLTPTEGLILSRVDGRLSVREVLQLLAPEVEDGERGLLGLLLTGRLEYLPPPAPAVRRPQPSPAPNDTTATPPPEPVPAAPPEADRPEVAPSEPRAAEAEPPPLDEAVAELRREILEAFEALPAKNHLQVLGLEPDATEAAVRERYVLLVKRFHPDSLADPRLADLRDMIEAIFIRVGEAYEVLASAKNRAAYEAALRRRPNEPSRRGTSALHPAGVPADNEAHAAWLAESEVERAEHLIQQGKYWDAIQTLESVLPRLASPKKKQRARVLLARAFIKNPKWVRRGEELLQTVVHEDPGNADAYFILGTIYKDRGLHSRAASMFRKALELKPDHAAAAAEISAPSPPRRRGLFGRY